MPDTYTTAYNLIKPEVGGSRDVWGTKWNGNADAIDLALSELRTDVDLAAPLVDVVAAIDTKAPKADPVFTGNGSVAGNWIVGGALDVTGPVVLGDNVAFKLDLNTGFRRVGEDDWRLVAGGVDVAKISVAGLEFLITPSAYKTPPGVMTPYAGVLEPDGWLWANGKAILRATYPALEAVIYQGDAANPTANYGYRCTDPANPTTTRSITGTYIVLPDRRGKPGIAAPDNLGGIDANRLTDYGDTRNTIGAIVGGNSLVMLKDNLPAIKPAVDVTVVHTAHEYTRTDYASGSSPGGGFLVNYVAYPTPQDVKAKTVKPPNSTASGAVKDNLGTALAMKQIPLTDVIPWIIKT